MSTTEWPIYRKRLRVAWVLVDDDDLPLIEPYLWRQHSDGYAWRYTDEWAHKGISMHRELCGLTADDPREVDHINGNRLDNRRCNLRVCTAAENRQNQPSRRGTSRYRGVSWNSKRSKWVAQGKVAGKTYYIGSFDDEQEAAQAAIVWRERNLAFTNESRAVA